MDIPIEEFGVSLREIVPSLDDEAVEKLAAYTRLFIDECQRQNISKYRTPQEVLDFHLLDSLEPLQHGALEGDERCIDIGTGGGCPGIPLKIAQPGLSMALLEARERRCDFLRRCVAELGLERTAVLRGRAEVLAHNPLYRASFDIALARSVASMRQLVEFSVPFLAPEGELWAFRGHNWQEELDNAQNALETLRAQTADCIEYQHPKRDTPHAFVVVTCAKPCPDQYPRSPNHVKKRPL